MTKDMTEGNPLKLILIFWLPLMAGSIFQQLYNMTDTVIVGRLIGVEALAGVGATGSINFLVIGFVMGLTGGFGIPIAQSFGAGDIPMLRKRVAHSIYLCIIGSAVLTALTMLTTRPLLELMQTPEDIFADAYTYIIIIFAGITATMFYNMFSTIMRSLGDSRTPLIFLTIGSLVNVGLDFLFIGGFKMGVGGASLATVISQAVSAALCLIYILRNLEILRIENKEELKEIKPSFGVSLNMLFSGIPMALQFSITAVGSIILQSAVNTFGSSVVASVTAASKLSMLVTGPMECLGITMATYSGQNLGAGKYKRIRHGIVLSTVLALIFSLIAFGIVALFGVSLSKLFLVGDPGKIDEITVTLKQILFVNGAFYFPLGVLLAYRNALQGLGFGVLAMTAGIFEMIARTAVAFLLVIPLGFDAICFANPAAWTAACVLLVPGIIYALKKLKRLIPEETAAE